MLFRSVRTQFDVKQKLALGNLINADYTKSGLTDTEFADMATKKLGFEIERGSIAHYRKGLEIEANKGSDSQSLKERLEKAEKELLTLKRAFLEEGRELPEGVTALDEVEPV